MFRFIAIGWIRTICSVITALSASRLPRRNARNSLWEDELMLRAEEHVLEQWHLERIQAGGLEGHEEIRVAIVDTGIDCKHPSLAGCIYQEGARDFDHADPERHPDGLDSKSGQID